MVNIEVLTKATFKSFCDELFKPRLYTPPVMVVSVKKYRRMLTTSLKEMKWRSWYQYQNHWGMGNHSRRRILLDYYLKCGVCKEF